MDFEFLDYVTRLSGANCTLTGIRLLCNFAQNSKREYGRMDITSMDKQIYPFCNQPVKADQEQTMQSCGHFVNGRLQIR
jgi:hypothetical protein